MGVTLTEASPERVVATMVVRPDLCTTGNAVHGGALMAFADTLGAVATVHEPAAGRADDDDRIEDQLRRRGGGRARR
jgi:acyl-coenzyme A thioesterase PaaI-like protein